MPCCRASCTAAAQSGSGIGERCARVLRQRSNCWRACSILTGTTGVFKRDISLFSLPWLGDRLTLSRSFRWGHAALPKPHRGAAGRRATATGALYGQGRTSHSKIDESATGGRGVAKVGWMWDCYFTRDGGDYRLLVGGSEGTPFKILAWRIERAYNARHFRSQKGNPGLD